MWRILFCMALELGLRAAAIVIFAWEALRITGLAGSAGWIFLSTALLGIFVGPFIGVLVDRIGGRNALLIGSVMTLAVFGAYAAYSYFAGAVSLIVLIVIFGLSTIGGLINTPALHSLLQTHTTPETATRIAAHGRTMISIGGVVGPIIGSMLLARYGLAVAILLCASTSFAIVVILITTPNANVISTMQKKTASHPIGDLLNGMHYLWAHPQLRVLSLTSVMAMAVSNFSAALLPSFVKFILELDVTYLGTLRSIWPVGAVCGGIMAGRLLADRVSRAHHAFYWIGCLGVATALFSQSDSFLIASCILLLSGATFSVARSVQDGLVLTYCEPDMIGRVRSNIASLIHLSAVGIFFLSAQASVSSLRLTFLILGLVLATSGVAAWLVSKKPCPRCAT